MGRLRIRRSVDLPDEVRVERHRRLPELGPNILFFSGGTAMRGLSRALKRYTHNSVHVITPFDSGGSSALLREAFDMPSVGDLRSRLIALADESARGNPAVRALFGHRFARDAGQPELQAQLDAIVSGEHRLLRAVPEPLRRILRIQVQEFAARMPASFDLRGASVGNLAIAGGYLHHERDLDSVLFLLSKLLEVLGTVRTATSMPRHIAATLEDGTRVVGQHRLTGKESPPLASPIRTFELVGDLQGTPCEPAVADDEVLRAIGRADLIVYPMGSFYSSVVANLLPRGIGQAIAGSTAPKGYIPNAGRDPEEVGTTVSGAVERLLYEAERDAGRPLDVRSVVDFVIIDSERGDYLGRLDADRLRDLGVEVVDVRFVTALSEPYWDPVVLAEVLVSID